MSSPIKDVLKTLHQHSDVVEQALTSVVGTEGHGQNASITALRQSSALRAAGEDGYRLHPRLRDYLHDHLQLFPAFQRLDEIGSRISQVTALWMEVDEMRKHSDTATINNLVDTIQSTVDDIVYSIDNNMRLLQSLMSTRYGDVGSLEAKKSQNRYYQKQTNILADDLGRLGKVIDKLEREASQRKMEELARFLRRNLLVRMMGWQQGISEMQTLIRKEIFRMQAVGKDLQHLARIDMLLRQQPSWRGFELDADVPVPAFMMAARLPALVPHVEPLDTDKGMLDEMRRLAATLPAKVALPEPDEPPKRFTRIVDAPHVPAPKPAAMAMRRLVRDVENAPAPISLAQWRLQDEDAKTMEPNVWLVFAIVGLRSRKGRVVLVPKLPRENEKFTHSFVDALAHQSRLVKARPNATAGS